MVCLGAAPICIGVQFGWSSPASEHSCFMHKLFLFELGPGLGRRVYCGLSYVYIIEKKNIHFLYTSIRQCQILTLLLYEDILSLILRFSVHLVI